MILRILLLASLVVPSAFCAGANDLSAWERSLVSLEINREGYDFTQPWTRSSVTVPKSGVVIDSKLILTTADQLNDLVMVRIQKGGRGKKYAGELVWLDYHANLALITCADDEFWNGLRKASFMKKIPLEGDVRLLRWRDGKLEARKMEINRPVIRPGKLTFIDLMHLEVDGDVQGIGWSEPVIDGGRMIGLMSEQTGTGGLLIPAPFIQRILEARKDGDYPGLGFFNFFWQRAENPATLKSLKLDSTDQGVIVIKSIAKLNEESILKPKDVILEVAGYEIGPEGDYQDPIYGRIMLEALASQKVWAGDEVPMKIWRDGKEMDIKYKLPKAEYKDEMIPDQNFDEPPQFLIAGGFVFQPLNLPYLKSWGGDWQRSAPFQLAYLKQAVPDDEREAIVILSMVLPDQFNVGYQSVRNLIVHEVNGEKIVRLKDIEEALKHPEDGYHIIKFSEGDSPGRIILDAEEMDRATQRIIRQYGIEKDRHIVPVVE
jgi:hypothetical protein